MLSKRYKILLVILVIASFVVVSKFGGKEIKNTFYRFSSPIEKVLWKAGEGISDFFDTLSRIKGLRKENEELTKQNLVLIREAANLKALGEENRNLRKALDIELGEEFELILTTVVTRELDGDFISIAGGSKDGIFENMPVITPEGILVGSILKSFPSFSQVILVSAKGNVFDVEIQGEQNLLGLAEGKGNSEIEFELVPKKSQIKRGDVVLTTALGGDFPQGLLVGEITEVRTSDVKPLQEGRIKPYFTNSTLTNLFVIKNFVREPAFSEEKAGER